MSEQRQKILLELVYPKANEGESLQDSEQGANALAAKTIANDPENLVDR